MGKGLSKYSYSVSEADRPDYFQLRLCASCLWSLLTQSTSLSLRLVGFRKQILPRCQPPSPVLRVSISRTPKSGRQFRPTTSADPNPQKSETQFGSGKLWLGGKEVKLQVTRALQITCIGRRAKLVGELVLRGMAGGFDPPLQQVLS